MTKKQRKVVCKKATRTCVLDPLPTTLEGSGFQRPFKDYMYYLIPIRTSKIVRKKPTKKRKIVKKKVKVADGENTDESNQVGMGRGRAPLANNEETLLAIGGQRRTKKQRKNIFLTGEGRRRRRSNKKSSKQKGRRKKRASKQH